MFERYEPLLLFLFVTARLPWKPSRPCATSPRMPTRASAERRQHQPLTVVSVYLGPLGDINSVHFGSLFGMMPST